MEALTFQSISQFGRQTLSWEYLVHRNARVRADVKPKCPIAGATASPHRQALRSGKSQRFGGSQFDAWNEQIIHDTAAALWVQHPDPDMLHRQLVAAYAGLAGIAPKDELEGMMAAQLIAAHSADGMLSPSYARGTKLRGPQ